MGNLNVNSSERLFQKTPERAQTADVANENMLIDHANMADAMIMSMLYRYDSNERIGETLELPD